MFIFPANNIFKKRFAFFALCYRTLALKMLQQKFEKFCWVFLQWGSEYFWGCHPECAKLLEMVPQLDEELELLQQNLM